MPDQKPSTIADEIGHASKQAAGAVLRAAGKATVSLTGGIERLQKGLANSSSSRQSDLDELKPSYRHQCGCDASRTPNGEPCDDQLCWDELWHPECDVHIERMDSGHVWMRVGEHMINMYATRKGRLEVLVEIEDDLQGVRTAAGRHMTAAESSEDDEQQSCAATAATI